jgi:hypothetical protein
MFREYEFLLIGIIIGLIVGIGGAGSLMINATVNEYREAAIERGYAQYCPKDGKFAWKDECEQ